MKLHKCKFCPFQSEYIWVVLRHLQALHKENINDKSFPIIIDNNQDVNTNNLYDIRLKENFKLFISGPSRYFLKNFSTYNKTLLSCGKTFFVCDLLQNLNEIVKSPPDYIIYVFKEFQEKYYEMKNVNIFIKDDDNFESNIDKYTNGRKPLIIFDDLI